jgi:hypothetical protein
MQGRKIGVVFVPKFLLCGSWPVTYPLMHKAINELRMTQFLSSKKTQMTQFSSTSSLQMIKLFFRESHHGGFYYLGITDTSSVITSTIKSGGSSVQTID